MLQHVNAAGTTYAAPHVATLAGPLFACDIGIQRPPALVAALEHSDGRRRRSARRDALIYEAIGRHVWDDGYAVVALGKLAAALPSRWHASRPPASWWWCRRATAAAARRGAPTSTSCPTSAPP